MILTQRDLRIRLQNIGTYFLDRMLCVGSRWLGLGLLSKEVKFFRAVESERNNHNILRSVSSSTINPTFKTSYINLEFGPSPEKRKVTSCSLDLLGV